MFNPMKRYLFDTGKLETRLWIGGLRSGEDWKWDGINQGRVAFADWSGDGPNNNVGQDDCIEANDDGRWSASACSQRLHYVCEKTN